MRSEVIGLSLLLLAGAAYTGAVVTAPAPAKAERKLHAEGTLIKHSDAEFDLGVVPYPDQMSIVFADRVTAVDYYNEAASLGERVCLSDLGARAWRGQRYWLRSC